MLNSSLKLSDFKTIAVCQTAFIGDVVLTLPLAQKIKDINPSCKLVFITTPVAKPFVECAGSIDTVIEYDKRLKHKGLSGIKQISSNLQNMNCELIITPHRSFRSTLLSYYTKATISVGFDKNSFSFLYKKRVGYDRQKHEIIRNLSLLDIFDDVSGELPSKIDMNIPEKHKSDTILKKNKIESGFVLIAPGSVWGTKRWKEDYFVELSKMFHKNDFDVIVVGSGSEKELADRIAEQSNATSLAGQTSLPMMFDLMARAKLLITNDSAPTHIAYIAGLPTITLFGPTIPEFGFAPIGKQSKVIETIGLKCRPCSIHGPQKCPIGTHDCMTSIKPDIVYSEAMQVIEK